MLGALAELSIGALATRSTNAAEHQARITIETLHAQIRAHQLGLVFAVT